MQRRHRHLLHPHSYSASLQHFSARLRLPRHPPRLRLPRHPAGVLFIHAVAPPAPLLPPEPFPWSYLSTLLPPPAALPSSTSPAQATPVPSTTLVLLLVASTSSSSTWSLTGTSSSPARACRLLRRRHLPGDFLPTSSSSSSACCSPLQPEIRPLPHQRPFAGWYPATLLASPHRRRQPRLLIRHRHLVVAGCYPDILSASSSPLRRHPELPPRHCRPRRPLSSSSPPRPRRPRFPPRLRRPRRPSSLPSPPRRRPPGPPPRLRRPRRPSSSPSPPRRRPPGPSPRLHRSRCLAPSLPMGIRMRPLVIPPRRDHCLASMMKSSFASLRVPIRDSMRVPLHLQDGDLYVRSAPPCMTSPACMTRPFVGMSRLLGAGTCMAFPSVVVHAELPPPDPPWLLPCTSPFVSLTGGMPVCHRLLPSTSLTSEGLFWDPYSEPLPLGL